MECVYVENVKKKNGKIVCAQTDTHMHTTCTHYAEQKRSFRCCEPKQFNSILYFEW